MRAEIIPVASIDNVWPAVAGEVVRCLAKTPTDLQPGDYWTMCRTGSALLIVCHDERGIRGVSIWHFHNGAFECLLMVGQDFGEWFYALHETARKIAMSNGCVLRATGRPGLARAINRMLADRPVRIIRQTIEIEV